MIVKDIRKMRQITAEVAGNKFYNSKIIDKDIRKMWHINGKRELCVIN